jgi:hypothetical protein
MVLLLYTAKLVTNNQVNMTINSATDFLLRSVGQTASVMIAGAIRRATLPTPAFIAFSIIHGVGTTAIVKGLESLERRVGLVPRNGYDKRTLNVINYVFSQVIGVALTLLVVKSLTGLGIALLYDMNRGSKSLYDYGSIFCIAGQTTLVTLFVLSIRDIKDMYKRIVPRTVI